MTMMMVCIAVDLARKFGLTAEQFGENLRDQYQRHDVEQDPAEPLDIAEQYIARYVCMYVCISKRPVSETRRRTRPCRTTGHC